MSRAFIKEGDDQWLEDIAPTQNALINFLTRENNGIRVYETGTHTAEDGTELFAMSNGLTSSKPSGRWKGSCEHDKQLSGWSLIEFLFH